MSIFSHGFAFPLGGDTTGVGKLVSSTSPGSLSADQDDARWTPVEITMLVPADMSALIIVRTGDSSSVLTLVAYSDELSGIQPLFSGKSVASIDGALDEDHTLTISILPNGGWTREEITVVPYIVLEAELISNTTEGQLAVTQAEARWTPISVSLETPPGNSLVVVAKIGTNSALPMVAYSDELDGFQPLFSEKSTDEVAGTVGPGRTIDMSLLPNGGWIRESVELTAFYALEATA